MSNTDLIIPERSRDIGDFLVGRLLPFRKKRMIGPFIFIDHMGPAEFTAEQAMDIDQHPHIGLCTLTYLLEGEIEHRDSLGTAQRIRPGSVNLMNAGKGVTHTERTPVDLRGKAHRMHGYQIWIALPKELEQQAPSFTHIPKEELPAWTEGSATFRLVAGEGYGRRSPVPTYSPLFMVEIKTGDAPYSLKVDGDLQGELGICIVEGEVQACDHELKAGQLLASKAEGKCALELSANSHILLFGGQPLAEKRFIFWNFVASDEKLIEAAKQDWQNKAFPSVQADNTYVPLPGQKH